jgi:hypothetical protein
VATQVERADCSGGLRFGTFDQCGRGQTERDGPVVVLTSVVVEPEHAGAGFSEPDVSQFVDQVVVVWERKFPFTDQLQQRGGDPADTAR